MDEVLLIKLLGALGIATFLFGLWLLRKGKDLEQRARHEYRTPTALIFGNYGPVSKWVSGLEPHSLKPLAHLCVVVGPVLFMIFAASLF